MKPLSVCWFIVQYLDIYVNTSNNV